MRCKFCGSKAIYPAKNHEQGGAGRVIAGAIIAGPVGAIAGFAGKNVKGYRCSACGMFSEQAMDFGEESLINSAVDSAKRGDTTIYERYQAKYANLEFIPFQQAVSRNAARLTTSDYDDECEDDETPIVDESANESVKHSYNPGQYVVGSPVFISNVTIKDDDGTDILCLDVSNISEKTLRSVYLNVTVYDDVGDQISTNTFAYQGLQAAPGESLQQAKPFKLNTNVAYKVDVSCEKAAFADDSVWRKEENPTVFSVADKTELTPEGFAQYKYLRALLDKKSTIPSDRKLYYPAIEETHRLCICGTPVTSGSKCPVCGLDEDTLSEVMDYDVLRQARKDVIASIAKERTEALQELRELMLKDRYQEAQKLLRTKNEKNYKAAAEIFASLSGYKDSDEQAKHCLAEAEICSKEENYQKAQQLLGKRTEKDCKKASEIFASLSGYKDSAEQAEHCIAEAEVCRKDEIYNLAVALMNTDKINGVEQAIAEFKKIPGWKEADKNVTTCQQKIEEIKAKEEADRIERERQAEIAREEAAAAEEARKKRNMIIVICAAAAALLVVFLCILTTVIIPNNRYNAAYSLLEQGQYEEAIKAFEELGDYKDSETQHKEAHYQLAMTYWNKQDYEASNPIFEKLGYYKDSKKKIHTHEFESEIITAPGCEEKGEEKLTCKTCPHTYTQPVDATGHTYGEKKVTKAPTCTVEGEHTTFCTVCNKTVTEAIAMLDHSYSSTVTKAATCEATGIKTFSCKCGKSYTETIKATGHSYNSGVVTTAATCDKNGVKTFSCKCGKSYTEVIKATGHSYNSGVVTTSATCDKDGVKTFSCKCGKSYTESIKATGHKYSKATCTSAAVCSVCGNTGEKALGHDEGRDKICTRCGINVLQPIEFVLTDNDASASTKAYKYFSDDDIGKGTFKITIKVLAVNGGVTACQVYVGALVTELSERAQVGAVYELEVSSIGLSSLYFTCNGGTISVRLEVVN